MLRERYTLIQRWLHWIIALSVLGLLAVGFTLGTLGFDGTKEAFGGDTTNLLYKMHKTFGVIVLVLMLLRLALRLSTPQPDFPTDAPEWMEKVGALNHMAFYALLIVQPVLGWLATAAGGFPVEFFSAKLPGFIGKDKALSETLFEAHEIVGFVIAALAALHIGAALFHWLFRKDGVMRRMSLF